MNSHEFFSDGIPVEPNLTKTAKLHIFVWPTGVPVNHGLVLLAQTGQIGADLSNRRFGPDDSLARFPPQFQRIAATNSDNINHCASDPTHTHTVIEI